MEFLEHIHHVLKQIYQAISSYTYTPRTHKYVINIQCYSAPQPIVSNFAEVTFFNAGTSILMVNTLPLSPGRQLSVNGNEYEQDTTNYFISFTGPGTNNCQIITKQYI